MSKEDARNHWQKPRGPVLSAGQVADSAVQSFPPDVELVLARSTTLDQQVLQRWVIGAAGEPFRWRECWAPSNENIFQALGAAGFQTTWGSLAARQRAVPAAEHSWDFLWTDGTGPLRVWQRRWETAVTLLDLGGTPPNGVAFRDLARPPSHVGPARIERTWLRESCVLSTSGGDVQVASRMRLGGAFVFLAGLAGALDPDPPPGAPVEALALRINESLGRR